MSQLLQHIEAERLSEMAMVDIAFEILRETNRPYNFRELMDQIAALRNMNEEQMMKIIAQVYTEVNIDGRFVCIGENTWGLKRWYSTEAVEETQEGGVKKKKVVIDDDFDDDYDMEEEDVFEEEDDIAAFDEDADFLDEEEIVDEDEIDEEEEDLGEEEELFEDEEEEEQLDDEEEIEEELD
ncbi:DNA-directed RNA polymerase subunit delta [Brevibacillus dissolubilis]|uniref:DNA-directed RNA polymerase subunit delta n=1 Tax=Brevibacillus dissolubilis TaxID=1844116 RepID=UPI0011175FDB|nr:DNA-directed RNA polymerase subunit delta [Brevibacillus dissolubilis]